MIVFNQQITDRMQTFPRKNFCWHSSENYTEPNQSKLGKTQPGSRGVTSLPGVTRFIGQSDRSYIINAEQPISILELEKIIVAQLTDIRKKQDIV